MLTGALYLLFTWLLASVPVGLLASLCVGGEVDLRTSGSGNIGATNVARLHGWRVASGVMALDMAKGFVPVTLSAWLFPGASIGWVSLVAIAAFVGHTRSGFLGFRGGKGVATGGGAMLGVSPLPTVVALAIWAGVLVLTRRSSVASLTATTVLVLAMMRLDPWALPVATVLAAGVFLTHLGNLGRLARGQEGAVVPAIRWGRDPADEAPTAEEVLDAGPAGPSVRPELWPTGPRGPADGEDRGPTGLGSPTEPS